MIDERGAVLDRYAVPYDFDVPRPGWTEQDPNVWWNAAQECIAVLSIGQFDAIGVTGQMHGSVFLDREGNSIRPALLWNDQRTTKACADIESLTGRERLIASTGNPMLTGFQLGKLFWLKENEPENFYRINRLLLPKDFIVYRLTSSFSTDVSDASGVGALNLQSRNWDESILDDLMLDREIFPPIHESWEVVGTSKGIPVVAGAGDQAAGAIGTGAVTPRILSLSLGTSGVVFRCLEQPVIAPAGEFHTFCHATGAYHSMGVTLNCGSTIAWARDQFLSGQSFSDLDELAAESPLGSNGVSFVPYLTGERSPYNAPDVRGSFAGISLTTARADLVRSCIEGALLALYEAAEALPGGTFAEEIRLTGGAAKSRLIQTIVATLWNSPVCLMASDEGPALGAAILAGVGIGIWPDVSSACERVVQVKKRVEPMHTVDRTFVDRYKALSKSVRHLARATVSKEN